MMLRYPGVMVCLQVHYFGRAGAVYTECVDGFGVWKPSSLLLTDAAGGSGQIFQSFLETVQPCKHVFSGAWGSCVHIINRPITFNGAPAAALSTYGTLATGKIAYPLRDFRTVSEHCPLLVHHRDGVERHNVDLMWRDLMWRDLMWRGLFDHGWPSLQGFLQKKELFHCCL